MDCTCKKVVQASVVRKQNVYEHILLEHRSPEVAIQEKAAQEKL